jgi:TPR repeat protein
MNGQSIQREMTDVELCIELLPEAGDDYRLALDVMTAYPDYAKSKFRIVVEHLTVTLAKKFNVDIENLDLYKSINELYECQIIDHSLRAELHAIRKLGNEVVHAKTDGSQESYKARGAGDLKSAVAARKTLVGVFESVFLLFNTGEELPKIATVEVDDITSQQTLWKAVSTTDFEAKMAAGLILEAQSLAPIPKGVMIIARSEHTHKKTTEKMAAELYWAACVISARVDRFSLMEIEKMGGEDACLFKYANTEALYRYSQLALDQSESEEHQRRGEKALEVSAKRGYSAACAAYGNLLRQKGQFDEAFEILSHALAKGDISGYAGLGLLYLEKSYSNYSQKLAEQYFVDGIASGSNHCEYVLGRFLYDGKELEQDKKRGKALLKSAADAGHETAAQYSALVVDDKLAKGMQEYVLNLMLNLPKRPVVSKQSRNELCQCDSGKKYKRCCGA